jgi:penicillin-binding protein 1C
MLDEKVAFLIADMLSTARRPDLPASGEFSPIRGRIAFKTGTSFGFRDAWCLAITPDYTLGLWLGNATAKGVAGLTAAKKAAPLAIEAFNRLSRTNDTWFQAPPGVARRKVCAHSGMVPGPHCPGEEEEWYVPGTSPYQRCDVHRQMWVRKKDGKRVHPDCMDGPEAGYQSKVFAIWPPDVTRYLRGFKSDFVAVPPSAPDCPVLADLDPPRIISPEPWAVYEITQALPWEQQRIAFSAQVSADVEKLYWFVGDVLIGESGPDELLFWQPRLGATTIGVVDSKGRGHEINIRVEEQARSKPKAG